MKARGPAVGCMLLLAVACGTGSPQADDPPVPSPTGDPATSGTASGGASPAPTTPTSGGSTSGGSGGGGSATEELLLPQQVQLAFGGDGLVLQCDLEDGAPASFQRDPGVWLHELFSTTEYPAVVMLCLRGFGADAPIDVEVVAGDLAVTSRLVPVAGAPPEPESTILYEEAPQETLFDPGATLPVHTLDYGGEPFRGPPGVMASEMWTFVPPDAAREALASAGELRLTVSQGDTTASAVQTIRVPATRDSFVVDPPGGRELVLHGYPPGDVPLGVYRVDDAWERGSLVREAGRVRVPASRVATWTWPEDLLAGLEAGRYCVLPPVSGVPTDCDATTVWPAYPGEASEGDSGPVVEAWQEILIQAGVMSDLPANRAGVYGPRTRAALAEHLRLNGIEHPADGARLDAELYAALTAGP